MSAASSWEPNVRTVTAEVVEQPCERCGVPVPVSIHFGGRSWGRRGPAEQAVTCSASCRTLLSRARVSQGKLERIADASAEARRAYQRLPDRPVARVRRSRECQGGCRAMIYQGERATIRTERILGSIVTTYLCGFCA